MIVCMLNGWHTVGVGGVAGQVNVRASPAQVVALAELESSILYFLALPGGAVPSKNWDEYLRSHDVSYDGSVTSKSVRLTWDQAEESLPPKANTAVIDVTALAEGEMRHYLLNPQEGIMDLEELDECPPAGKCMHEPGERLPLARGFLERGMVVPLR